ncbi:MAG: GDSL lipase/esterase [Benjaminiella poitrasii]|nr:MAG: GDSL lipase/esterase [Benjaminiella poitrasii]
MHILFYTCIIASLLSAFIVNAKIDKVIVYADSFTDNGNDYNHSKFPPSPPYYQGRFSNGPTWLEYVAKNISVPVSNNGYGGATTNNDNVYSRFNNWTVPGLKQQIATLDTKGTNNSLYIIEIGYNDLNAIINPHQYHVVDKKYSKEKIAKNVVDGVKALVQKFGAKEFVIMNVAPFDQWPVVKQADKARAAKLINDYNSLVEMQLKNQAKNVHLNFIDTHAWFVEMIEHPERLGLSVTNGPCIWGIGNTTACSDPENHFFWDSYHPEAKVHKAWGNWTTQSLKATYMI